MSTVQERRRFRQWLLPSLIAGLGGLVWTGLMMQAAWDHNPQGVIYDENGVYWTYWLLLGFSWFVPGFVLLFVVSYLLSLLKLFISEFGSRGS